MVARLAELVNASFLYAFCYACLSKKLVARETEVRTAAEALLLQPDTWQERRRTCYACGAVAEILERRV